MISGAIASHPNVWGVLVYHHMTYSSLEERERILMELRIPQLTDLGLHCTVYNGGSASMVFACSKQQACLSCRYWVNSSPASPSPGRRTGKIR